MDSKTEDCPSPSTKLRTPRKVLLLRYTLFVLAGLISLIVVFYTVENVRGSMAWKKAQAKAAAMNISLDLESILPDPIPDESNAASSPIFSTMYNFGEKPGLGVSRAHRNQGELDRILASLSISRTPGSKPRPDPFKIGRLSDLEAWANYFKASNDPFPFQIDDDANATASIILSALDDSEPLLTEIIEASSRPACVFPIHYEDHVAASFSTAQCCRHPWPSGASSS
ncbi:MAG TPA: hypothetical protein EYQ50_22510 [Verrucomicrobiales bacterium]|nr:hypothetical protein [Verrucomicrobiales bacterium]HIL69025.1 hypothetical protein [Verrucomicrobiota bacterium]